MLRAWWKRLGVLLVLALVVAALGLGWAHLALRGERTPLPDPARLTAPAATDDLPVRLSVINTASQEMPRGAVLDAARDPRPGADYVMSHPSFALEWADGRILLIDAGMTRQGAIDFGDPIELLSGGAPIVPHGSAAEQLGQASSRVRGIVFTHLHLDHVGGVAELCGGRSEPLPVFMTEAQDERPNYTSRSGRDLLRSPAASCVVDAPLLGEGPLAVLGFPGVAVLHAAGHTPDSQMVLARVRTAAGVSGWIFTGDAANALDGILADVPKPLLYRLLVIPEDEPRMAELRRFVRELGARPTDRFAPLVSHDQRALEQSGAPAWGARP